MKWDLHKFGKGQFLDLQIVMYFLQEVAVDEKGVCICLGWGRLHRTLNV